MTLAEVFKTFSVENSHSKPAGVLTIRSRGNAMKRLQMFLMSSFLLMITGCDTNHQDHHARIGRGSEFTSFTFDLGAGRTFAFTTSEMRALEKVWSRTSVSGHLAITNSLYATPRLSYSFELSDGYSLTSDAYLGSVSGVNYLSLVLPTGGGGFLSDQYNELVPLASILSSDRQAELMTAAGIETANQNSIKQEEPGPLRWSPETEPSGKLGTDGSGWRSQPETENEKKEKKPQRGVQSPHRPGGPQRHPHRQ